MSIAAAADHQPRWTSLMHYHRTRFDTESSISNAFAGNDNEMNDVGVLCKNILYLITSDYLKGKKERDKHHFYFRRHFSSFLFFA
jgi:hypothetical protein